ncbi:hypothetical protein BH09VER1_BH09VER1_24670 [soil metagenome]
MPLFWGERAKFILQAACKNAFQSDPRRQKPPIPTFGFLNMALTITQKPLAEVTDTLSAKTPIGSILRSAEWENVPTQLRETAFFSARVESARALAEAQAALQKILNLSRDANGAISMDRGKFIAEMQKMANALGLRNTEPGKRGGLEDFGSERRLKLIYEQQIGQAQSKAYYLSGQDPDVLDAWPAQELIRLREPKGGPGARRDWAARWSSAGGKFYGGRMIALKTSPIWIKISRFGRPWPPFDYSSGMGLEEIDRETAEQLGLIKPGEIIEPSVERDQNEIMASVKGLAPDMRAALKEAFGNQISVNGDQASWTGSAPPPLKPAPKPEAKAPAAPDTSGLPQLQPQGPAVTSSAKMDFSTKKDSSRHAATMAIVDAVHGDGALEAIPFNNRISSGSYGTYWSNLSGAVSLGVKRSAPFPGTVLTHEVGHWLDNVGITSPTRFASESNMPIMQEWISAVKDSEAYRKLATSTQPKHRVYYQSMRETWARAYAQFIAVESGNPSLLSDLADFKAVFPAGAQWEKADFEPVRLAMRNLFVKLGWMK